jgi:hypothetical protein
MMKKLMFVAGAAVGYVLGTRAGREHHWADTTVRFGHSRCG